MHENVEIITASCAAVDQNVAIDLKKINKINIVIYDNMITSTLQPLICS
ncbi:hypothetical protein QBD01_005093 [Ochrobactrum sp. 19YEA23]|nr:hypothetical protein [Ochrobactrum sp. 19YEA23]